MNRRVIVLALFLVALLVRAHCASAQALHTFTVANGRFQLDGHPYQIISGEMHYPRVPRAYWRDRFRKARAMGLNTITTYVFWNVHEPRPGVYDFSGNNDVAEYIREAQQEGLNVILRPGPYVCAEWDLGGFPSWLLKDRSIVLRSTRSQISRRHERAGSPGSAKELSPLQIQQWRADHRHPGRERVRLLRQRPRLHGSREIRPADIRTSCTNGTCSTQPTAPAQVPNGSLPDLPAVINFGIRRRTEQLRHAQKAAPRRPISCPANTGLAGSITGVRRTTPPTPRKKPLSSTGCFTRATRSACICFTAEPSFGWMNGANSNGNNYEPDVTSYDYDAPLDESGRPTPKYFAFRNIIARVTGKALPAIPPSTAARAYSIAPGVQTASLWNNLPAPVESDKLLTMEDLDQSYGYILYRTQIDAGPGGELVIDGLHDYAQIYINQKLIGSMDRRLAQSHLTLPAVSAPATLDILVENTGRVNFTKVIRTERKGITGSVTIAEREPKHWQIYSLPMADLAALHFTVDSCEGPCFYRFSMDVPSIQTGSTTASLSDTFLNMHADSKGTTFLNGHPLGRFWSIGPEFTLYTPGPWLQLGANEIILFDLQGKLSESISTTDHADYGPPRSR